MNAFINYDSAINLYLRIRNDVGQFYNFTTEIYQDLFDADCKTALVEYPNGDGFSLYIKSVDGIIGWHIREIITDTNEVVGTESDPTLDDVTGDITVNHDYPTVDNLRFVTSTGAGIDNATINIYLKSDYIIGNTTPQFIVATNKTKLDGRWESSIKLDSGFVYVVEFYKQGSYKITPREITT